MKKNNSGVFGWGDVVFHVFCPMKFGSYPMDSQVCPMKVGTKNSNVMMVRLRSELNESTGALPLI